ncbi:MAG: helix-turn-helix domain-containing protein [Pseudomonadota bacterium]
MAGHTNNKSSGGGDSRLRTETLADAGAQARAQDWLDFDCFQIERGAYAGQISRLDLGGLHLVREQQDRAVYKLGHMPAGRCTVSILINAGSSARFMQHISERWRDLFLLPGDVDFDLLVPADCQTLYVSLDQDKLLARGRAMDPEQWSQNPDRLQCLGEAGRRAFIQAAGVVEAAAAAGHISDAGQMERLLSDEILMAMHTGNADFAHSSSGPPIRRRRLQILRAAHDYIVQALEDGYTPGIADICTQVGAAERTLQYCFRDLLQMTPVAYLRILRLNRVRAELRDPPDSDTTITQAALRFGFVHAGQFSRDYRLHFDESPSVTLAQANR